MGVESDYYVVLGLTRSAGDIDIKKAFRRLSLKYHPDSDSSAEAHAKFVRVCEAYEVLTNPKTKGFYDLYGEKALKSGLPDGQGGMRGGFFSYDGEAAALQTFEAFFGTKNPFQALDDLSNQFEGMTAMPRLKMGKHKTYDVALTMEEIYHGCMKKVTCTKKILKESGEVELQEATMTIDVKPGLPEGTRFVFEGEGNVTPTTRPGPIVFVLHTQPHPRFRREGADLVHEATVPLVTALAGGSLPITLLDNRVLTLPLASIVTPGHRTVVKGEGLPKPTGGKGDLVVSFKVLFPATLTQPQKALLKAAFLLPHKLSEPQAKAVRSFEAAFLHDLHGWSTGFVKGEGGAQ